MSEHQNETQNNQPQQDWAARRAASKKARKRNAVLKYLVILFAAAFLLLLFSYVSQQRSNQAAIDNLEETSNSAAQTLENMLAERDKLREENANLKAQQAHLTHALNEAKQAAQEAQSAQKEAQETADALNGLNQLRTLYNKRRYQAARDLLDQWEAQAPGQMEARLKAHSEGLSDEERKLYDPLGVYHNLISWLGWKPTPAQ